MLPHVSNTSQIGITGHKRHRGLAINALGETAYQQLLTTPDMRAVIATVEPGSGDVVPDAAVDDRAEEPVVLEQAACLAVLHGDRGERCAAAGQDGMPGSRQGADQKRAHRSHADDGDRVSPRH